MNTTHEALSVGAGTNDQQQPTISGGGLLEHAAQFIAEHAPTILAVGFGLIVIPLGLGIGMAVRAGNPITTYRLTLAVLRTLVVVLFAIAAYSLFFPAPPAWLAAGPQAPAGFSPLLLAALGFLAICLVVWGTMLVTAYLARAITRATLISERGGGTLPSNPRLPRDDPR